MSVIDTIQGVGSKVLNVGSGALGDLTALASNDVFPSGPLREHIVCIKDKSGKSVVDVPLQFDGRIDLQFQSSFTTLFSSQPSKLMTLISQTIGGFSGQFTAQGAQIWEKTEPLSFSVNVELDMGNRGALVDVVQPSLTLASLCLPSTKESRENETKSKVGKVFNAFVTGALIPPGPNLSDIASKMGIEIGGETSESRGEYDIDIGWLKLTDCIITGAKPSYGNVMDSDGFPTTATVSLDISTANIPTVNYVEDMIANTSNITIKNLAKGAVDQVGQEANDFVDRIKQTFSSLKK